MKETLIVLKHELSTTLQRRSFQYTAFGVPLIALLIFTVTAFIKSDLYKNRLNYLNNSIPVGNQQQMNLVEGYIDYSGLIRTIPESPQKNQLFAFYNEVEAKQAISEGTIRAYYIIPRDYLNTGEIVYVRPDFNPFFAYTQKDFIEWVLSVNLLDGDTQLASLINSPLTLKAEYTEQEPQVQGEIPLAFFLPFGVTLFFYITILMSSSLLLSSLTKDKQSRILEILLVTITPRQILSGKIIALGIAGLIQTVCWMGTAYLIVQLSGSEIRIPFADQIPPYFLLWIFIFFMLGYALYASLMASIGALVTNLREASQISFFLLLPMMIPLLTISILISSPNSSLAIFLSLFPLTSPVTMLTRLVAVEVPLWQPLLSAGLLITTMLLVLHLVSQMFRMQVLYTGKPFQFRRLLNFLGFDFT